MRVLVLSHHHPEIVAGGAERAAYSLFQALRADSRVSFATFVANAQAASVGHSAYFGSFRSRTDEIVVSLPPVDGFTLESLDLNELARRIKDLIEHLRPDIVHLHHVLNWGIETIELFARAGVRVVLTLHEFILICHQNGQMLKTNGELCHEASFAECSRCFPEYSPGKFFVRAAILQRILRDADVLISPSRFLASRFDHWMGSADRIVVIENVLGSVATHRNAPRGSAKVRSRKVLGFFGQINPYKGVDVLLEACTLLSEEAREALDVRVYGENKHWLGGDFDRRLKTLFDAAEDGIRKFGSYRNEDVIKLMRGCDWIVVPSIWWENAPVVIEEAKAAGCGVICSDLGGMAEKTDDSIDLRFPAGNAPALADLMEEIAFDGHPINDSSRHARAVEVKAARNRALEAHIGVYKSLLEGKAPIHPKSDLIPDDAQLAAIV